MPSTGEALAGEGGADRRGMLVLIGGGLGYKMYSQHQEELAKVQAEKERMPRKRQAKRRAGVPARGHREGHERQARQGRYRRRTQSEFAPRPREAKVAAQQNVVQGSPATQDGDPGQARAVPKSKVEKRDISDNPARGLVKR